MMVELLLWHMIIQQHWRKTRVEISIFLVDLEQFTRLEKSLLEMCLVLSEIKEVLLTLLLWTRQIISLHLHQQVHILLKTFPQVLGVHFIAQEVWLDL